MIGEKKVRALRRAVPPSDSIGIFLLPGCQFGQLFVIHAYKTVCMSEDANPFENQETIEASVTVTQAFAERLADQYAGSLSLSEALRDAAEDAVTYREQEIAPEDITESTREALEQATPIAVDPTAVEHTEE